MRNTDGMICTLKSDLFRLKKRKSVWIGLIVMFALMLIMYAIIWSFGLLGNVLPDDPDEAIAIWQLAEATTALGRYSLAGFSETCSLALFVAIITCLFVGKDFSEGTMRVMISRGTSRANVYLSKWLCLAMLVVAYSVFAILVCGIFTSFKGYGEPFTAQQFGLLMRCFALQLLCNISTMTIVMMIAFLLRSSGSAIGATIGIFIALSIVMELITGLGVLKGNITWTYFMPLQQNSLATQMTEYSTAQLCAVLIMPLVYGALAYGLGLLSFLKRDIK